MPTLIFEPKPIVLEGDHVRLEAVREGVLRKSHTTHSGYVRDSVYYSIIDDEWPAVK
ncbi:MAG: hypothetical protein IIA64_08575, partial [Planctomycetes bacterium]|nr:hypothetical protein [Planctomycetota bacterium]